MRPVLHNRIQVGVTLQRKNPKGNNNRILSGVSYNTDHVLFQVCFYLTSAPFGCADKPAEKHCWLICCERKILFRLKKQAEKDKL
jgi:hypothetical protein